MSEPAGQAPDEESPEESLEDAALHDLPPEEEVPPSPS